MRGARRVHRVSRRRRCHCCHVVGRETLRHYAEACVHHAGWCRTVARQGSFGAAAAGGVVVAGAGIEPDFVARSDAAHGGQDSAVVRIDDDVARIGRHRPVRVPDIPFVSNTMLQPIKRFWFGPRVRPAGPQKFTGYVASTLAENGLMRTTPPFCTLDPICGMDRKKRLRVPSQTACSAPFWASTPCAASNVIRALTVRWPVLWLTMTNVAKGGVSAVLTTSSTPCVGS